MSKTNKDFFNSPILDSKIKSESIEKKERIFGYLLGPFSVLMLNRILNNYLNVYYTDVLNIGNIWGGWFLSMFPIVVKAIDALTFIAMGWIIDRFHSRQGKARPWILLSAPLLIISMMLLFVVPDAGEWTTVIWIFLSYNLFYSIAYTAYNTSHTLMVPLATKNSEERGKLAVLSNTPSMIAGTIVAVIFPALIVPAMGVDKKAWMTVMCVIALVAFPFVLLEYFYTRERVTEQSTNDAANPTENKKLSIKQQFSLCLKSRNWKILMIYLVLYHVVTSLANTSTFYYCNWVLGSYNDGITQTLYYLVGNAPLGFGIALCNPLCKKFGRKRTLQMGYILAACGSLLCVLNAKNMVIVLIGQMLKAFGIIPASFLVSALLGDALDDVEKKTGVRCDGFSSSIYNIIITVSAGAGIFILNMGLSKFGYIAPQVDSALPVQNDMIQNFLIFASMGCQVLIFPLVTALLGFFENPDNKNKIMKKKS